MEVMMPYVCPAAGGGYASQRTLKMQLTLAHSTQQGTGKDIIIYSASLQLLYVDLSPPQNRNHYVFFLLLFYTPYPPGQ